MMFAFAAALVSLAAVSSNFDVAQATPLRGLARNALSDLVLVERIRSASNIVYPNENIPITPNNNVPVGEALDIFYRYGFFSLSVRVVPRDDPGKWLIREPTASIFEENTVSTKVNKGSNNFNTQFQVYLCDDVSELQQAYFRDFTADGVEEPHKLYTGSWHSSTKSKYLGLSKEIFEAGESSFVLIKLPKNRISESVVNMPTLKSEAGESLDAIKINDPESVLEFVNNYGSHYIKDVALGEEIYQVLALTADQYRGFKQSVQTVTNGRKSLTMNEFTALAEANLAPWNIKETGKVLAASGDVALLSFLNEKLVIKGQFGTYPSLLALQRNPSLQDEMERISANSKSLAVVGLNFASLRNWVRDIQTREYYDEIVGAQTALWETNIARK